MSYECADFFMTRVAMEAADREKLSLTREAFIGYCLQKKEFLEAIAIASPTLYQAVKGEKGMRRPTLRCSSTI